MKAILCCLVVMFIGLFGITMYKSTVENVSCLVTEKEVTKNSSSSYYLIFCEDNEIYSLKDSWLFWEFNSSNKYAKINIGDTHDFKVVGWRLPFFSTYQNIIEVN